MNGKRIYVYVSDIESKKIKKSAASAGLSVSNYLVQCGLKKGTNPILNQAEIATTSYRLIEKANSCKIHGCSQETCPLLSDILDMIQTKFYGRL